MECVQRWAKPHGHWEPVCNRDDIHTHLSGGLPWPPPKPEEGDSWGPWVYHAKTRELGYRDAERGREMYWVDLDRCRSTWELLDWTAQLEEKAWLSADGLGWLVRALQDIVGLRRFGPAAQRPA